MKNWKKKTIIAATVFLLLATVPQVTGTVYDGWYTKTQSYDGLINQYLILEQEYPEYVEVFKANELYGTGVVPNQDYDLYYVRITNESIGFHKPEVLFVGGTHGNETVNINCLYWAVDWLLRNSANDWISWLLDNREIYIVPCHNPWGFDNNRRYEGSRLPSKGYDLNRFADHMPTVGIIFPTVNGKTIREFVNNHQFRIGVFLHDGARAILYPWAGQHNVTPSIIGISPISGMTLERVPCDFYYYDASGLLVGDYIGDYGGDLNKYNIENSYSHGHSEYGGCIPHWGYGGNTDKNPAEIPYVEEGSYPGCGMLGFTPEISINKNASEDTYGNDTIVGFGTDARRQLLFFTDLAQPSVHWLNSIPSIVDVGTEVNFSWDVAGCLAVDHTFIEWGRNYEYATNDYDEHLGDYYGGSRWDNAENGIIQEMVYSENITLNETGDYYFRAKAMVDQVYADVIRPDYYGNESYLRMIQERTNNSYHEELMGTDGLEVIDGQLWWYSPVIHISVVSDDPDINVNLTEGWNLVGMPCNNVVQKEDIIIEYDGVDYSWDEATNVSNHIILGFIYGWNTEIQYYEFVDEFHPGKGYWMYSYYDCILKI